MDRSRWRDLPRGTRRLIHLTAITHLILVRVTYADISRRCAEEVRGPKRLWRTVTPISFTGAAAYFLFGRR